MGQLGADVEALDRLSKQFQTSSTALQNTETSISSLVTSAWWKGLDADTFKNQWTSTHKPRLKNVGTTLERLAKNVKEQAEQQRKASEGNGWVNPSNPSTPTPTPTNPNTPVPFDQRVLQLGEMQDATQPEQATWWKGLSEAERIKLIETHPDRVYSLKGIPADDLARAKEGWLKDFRGVVPTYTVTHKVKGEFDIKVFEAEVGAHAKVMRNLDGTYSVEFKVEGDVAAKFGLEGSGTLRYNFGTEAEAQAFRDGFYKIFTDGWKEIGGLDAGWDIKHDLDKANSLIPDAVTYLKDSPALASVKVEGGVKADIELKAGNEDKSGLSAEAQVAGGAWKDLKTGDWGFYARGEIEGRAGLDENNAASAKGEIRIDLQFNESGDVTKIKLGGEVGGKVQLANLPTINTKQANLKFLAELDVSDPNTQAAVKRLMSGDISVDEFTNLVDQGQVIVYGGAGGGYTAKGPIDLDWGPLKITSETSVDFTGPVWVHPAGGDWELLER